MKRDPVRPHIVSFTADEVCEMLLRRLRDEGIAEPLIAVQICVQHPFEGGMRVHGEVPALNMILSKAALAEPTAPR